MWIDVNKDLPKDVTAVLAYSECCNVCSYMYIAEIEDGDWFNSNTGDSLDMRITHWMELPKPPVNK